MTFRLIDWSEGREWDVDAACSQADPDAFFVAPDGGLRHRRMAKEICRRCPVRDRCLAEALDLDAKHGTQHGIWGGLDERERLALRRPGRHDHGRTA